MKRHIDKRLLCRLIIDLELSEEEIEHMSRNEMFAAILNYEGYRLAEDLIKELILEVYGIDLNHWEEYLDPESVAEMEGREEY